MRGPLGEYGGVVLRPLMTGGGRYLAVGSVIDAATAVEWPIANRLGLASQRIVRWLEEPAVVAAAMGTTDEADRRPAEPARATARRARA